MVQILKIIIYKLFIKFRIVKIKSKNKNKKSLTIANYEC